MTPRLIPFGRIARAHGVRGELRLVPYEADGDLPPDVENLWLKTAEGEPVRHPLEGARPGPGAWLVRLEGVRDRDAASALRGSEVWVSADELPPLEDGEFYLHDLVGLDAHDAEGALLGAVVQVESLPGQDVLTLSTERGRRMVPITDSTVIELRRDERRVVVAIPEGLLE